MFLQALLNVSEVDFCSKTQNFIFACCSEAHYSNVMIYQNTGTNKQLVFYNYNTFNDEIHCDMTSQILAIPDIKMCSTIHFNEITQFQEFLEIIL